MIKISIPKKYIKPLDKLTKRLIDDKVDKYGVAQTIEDQFVYLDCTRVKDGLRLMQTIGHPYIYDMSILVYLINTYVKEEGLEEYYDRLDKLHKANIKYEKSNPPIVYKKKQKTNSKKKELIEPTIKGLDIPKLKLNIK